MSYETWLFSFAICVWIFVIGAFLFALSIRNKQTEYHDYAMEQIRKFVNELDTNRNAELKLEPEFAFPCKEEIQ